MHSHIISTDLTRQGVVYPGHPLVLATIIMEEFDSFDDANGLTKHGCCEALSDSRIPGAGDHVGAAMRTLEIGAKGGTAQEVNYPTAKAGGLNRNV